MKRPSILEFTGHMLTYKESLKVMADSIKDVENQVEDNLQHALVKSSNLIKLNKNIKEIELMSEALADLQNQGNLLAKEKLMISLRRKIFESQCLLIEDIQKSMLKAVEAMSDTGNEMLLLTNFNRIVKVLNRIDEEVEGI
ncbi:MAG: hypothetical protein PHE70_02885 [Tepidanaerobacteraceae bacterium]|nr:hypothetical protein [Tepidanaerobacteraceae bacterium]